MIANHGRSLAVEDATGEVHRCVAGRRLDRPVTGDRVLWRPDTRGHGVVSRVLPRRSLLARPDERSRLRSVAANLDQILIVVATRPAFQEALIDRYLVVAEHSGIRPVIVLNKTDLPDQTALDAQRARLELYAGLGYPVRLSSIKRKGGLDPLAEQLDQRTSILVGQSGVGKSSLVKGLLPDVSIRIGAISERTTLGRHTTTVTTLYHLPNGGHIVDSPGVRDFGVWHIPARDIAGSFPEFRDHLGQCHFRDCSHRQEPGCAVRAAVAAGRVSARRHASYQAILTELEAN